MEDVLSKIVLFSGRFDPPHIGHIITISKLVREFKEIMVVVLDYSEAEYPLCYRKQALSGMMNCLPGLHYVIDYPTHFAEITKEEISKFKFDVYASGNLSVLKHIESLGIPTLYVERSFDYSATEIREKNIKKIEN